VTSWNGHPAGRVLLADLPEPALAAEPDGWPFDDEPGGGDPFAAATAGGPAAPAPAAPAPAAPAPAAPAPAGTAASAISVLARSSPDRERRIAQVISAWQEHVRQLVQAENVTKRSIARMVSFDDESLALVLTIGVLGFGGGEVTVSEGTGAAPQAVLTSLFGAGLLRDIGTRARRDLHERISQLFDQEMERFIIILDSAGAPDEEMIAQMHRAGYVLEASR